MKPHARMIADPDAPTCEATFEVSGEEAFTTRLTNAQYFKLSHLLNQAYRCGQNDGARYVAVQVRHQIKEHLPDAADRRGE